MSVARVALLALLAGCPSSSGTTTPKGPDDTAVRVEIAQLEARRADGIGRLAELAKGTAKHERVLALRGLGRIGGARAIDVLVAALADPDPDIIGAAATAIGIAMSLDDDAPPDPVVAKALLAALEPAKTRAVDVIEALGRAADASAQPVLVGLLAGKPELAAASAIALGRFGRRKIALGDQARAALERALAHADRRVRYAAAYAFAREHEPVSSPATARSLARLIADPDGEVRAIAVAALGKRKLAKAAQRELIEALHDADWRVAVEAVRALTADGDPKGVRFVAIALSFWLHAREGAGAWVQDIGDHAAVTNGHDLRAWKTSAADPAAVQVVLEGLRHLAKHAADPIVAAQLRGIAKRAATSTSIATSWIECLAIVAQLRGAQTPDYQALAACRLPDHLRLPLVGELVAAEAGTVEQRREALRPLLSHADARVRAAGITALVALWKAGDDADRRATAATLTAALDSKDPLIAGTAVEAVPTIYEAARTEWQAPLEAAIVARANTEKDPELAGALFELIGKQAIASGLPACRAGLAGAPVLAKAAAKCMKALGHAVDAPAITGATPPAFGDVRMVIGKQVTWRLSTTRGEIAIELSPDAAPWAVAMIATLTRKGFYNGLEMHRVVPNFVAQGGDPTQSGWGGPGFTLPAEPSPGAGFVVGGVGIADAGRDSGGSQWFVMHGAAPHLDGRYTWIGRVASGQKSADALVIGDAVTHATIEIKDRP